MSVPKELGKPHSPWQLLYGTGHRLRRAWYDQRARHLPRPVVSVGNLQWGGSGKTPVTAAIARHWVGQGLRVAILSRGYGREDRQVRMVSVGEGPLLGPKVAGDEPVLLAGEVPGAAVVVAPSRYDAGRHAMERLDPAPDLFLLDDGFSHLDLARDLDLLVFPADDPFANGRLWPSGRLREPLASARHAAAAIAHGPPGTGAAVAEALRVFGFTGTGFDCQRALDPPRLTTGEIVADGTRVLLVSGLASPAAFETSAKELALVLAGALVFPDHHDYPQASLATIASAFADGGAEVVLTTSKDRVKLLGRLDLPLAELPLRAEPEASFWAWLDREVDRVRSDTPS